MNDAVDTALDRVVAALGGDYRAGQHEMAEAVADTLDGNVHLLVQAGTGTGKSLAYLVPALLHATGLQAGPVVVATATLALQRQLVDRDLPRIVDALASELPRPPRYAVLKGRNNYVCLQRLHGAVPDDDGDTLFETSTSRLSEQARAVRAWAESTTTGDRDEYDGDIDARVWRSFSVSSRECVGESRCAFGAECFTALRRFEAFEADVVVTNHAMLAIDSLEDASLLPEHDAVIIDEAHELIDRATTAMTAELNVRALEQAISRARTFITPETLDQLDDAVANLQITMEATPPGRIVDIPRDLLLALTTIRDSTHNALGQIGGDRDTSDADTVAARARAQGALDEVHQTAGRMIVMTANDVMWLEASEQRSPTLRLAPLSIGAELQRTLFADSPVVLTSATLTTAGRFDAVAGALGMPDVDAWRGLDVGSPFDYARQGILYVAAHLPPPNRDGTAMEALDELAELIDAAGGRTLALFSSWRGVERAAEYLRVRFGDRPDRPILIQQRGDSVGPLIDAFAADPQTTLLGTLTLWQGVDVPGEACHLVVIDRIPFPRPDDPIVAARQQHVDESGGSGFRSVSVPRAGLMLAQGVGRLIRGPADRGVVAVLDPRLATANYAEALRGSLPPFWFTVDKTQVCDALRRLDTAVPTTEN